MSKRLQYYDKIYDGQNFEGIKNTDRNKPIGGLWTSSFHKGRLPSDWASWIESNYGDYSDGYGATLLKPSKDAKIFKVDGRMDEEYLLRNYPAEPTHHQERIDWESMSKDYDAVHLTHSGKSYFSNYHHTKTRSPFDGWDVESTLWFRPKFSILNAMEVSK